MSDISRHEDVNQGLGTKFDWHVRVRPGVSIAQSLDCRGVAHDFETRADASYHRIRTSPGGVLLQDVLDIYADKPPGPKPTPVKLSFLS